MIKIKEYKITKQGWRGNAISVPKVWVDDNNLGAGDVIEFYRDEHEHLVLVPKKRADGMTDETYTRLVDSTRKNEK